MEKAFPFDTGSFRKLWLNRKRSVPGKLDELIPALTPNLNLVSQFIHENFCCSVLGPMV